MAEEAVIGTPAGVAVERPAAPAREYVADRRWDILLLFGAFFVITAAGHLTVMLTAGDWDFWPDWKDRQWWPIVFPTAAIIIPSAIQYIVWTMLRLPLGATLTVICLLFGEWLNRITNFSGWVGYPLNFVWPGTILPSALVLDLILMRTNSYVLTSVIGGFIWSLLFWPSNWPMIAQFYQPINFHGYTLTVADVMGFQYVRTGDHEYQRLIELGNLRAFLQETLFVAAFFGGFTSMFTYWVGQAIGRFLAVAPMRIFLKQT